MQTPVFLFPCNGKQPPNTPTLTPLPKQNKTPFHFSLTHLDGLQAVRCPAQVRPDQDTQGRALVHEPTHHAHTHTGEKQKRKKEINCKVTITR